MVDTLANRGFDDRVLDAMRAVPRHKFVPSNKQSVAYEDRPLPIGNNQTVSAPHMVAMMADELDLTPGTKVLEIGTGCGYHAAVTAELVGASNLYSVEFDDRLAEEARDRLTELGYGDIHIRVGDGRDGWPDHAPYDAIYLTCAAAEIPPALRDQLRNNGTILAPIGTRRQELVRATLDDGDLHEERLGGVRFVQMRGD